MKEVATLAANLLAASARTAPKSGGKDFQEIVVVKDEGDLKRIAETMQTYAPKSTNAALWRRDADNIEQSNAEVLMGLGAVPDGRLRLRRMLASHLCGIPEATPPHGQANGLHGTHGVMRTIDIGVALPCAAKTAERLSIDNRVQQCVEAAARALGPINAEVVTGCP